FNTRHLERFMTATETMEGIRALVIDKDRTPRWNPARLEDVRPEMGWDPRLSSDLMETEPPTPEELRLLREELDPLGVYRS
ncbi:MAG: enoyl-CoA hydratase/isomerase family protein, partial [Anaerolineae bacterium]|nr:enoyl-CoA hydratase/isomerase family protein [Anaerolineae bacterium]